MRNDIQMSNCYYTWEMIFKRVTVITHEKWYSNE